MKAWPLLLMYVVHVFFTWRMFVSHVLSLRINLRICRGKKELIILKNAFCRNVVTAILKTS